MVHEMKRFKQFYQRCTNPNIYPMVDQVPIDIVYAIRPSFQLRNKRTGIISLTNTDMDQLLEAWNF